jgi:tetratricopeptide (TPR) repeat protein
MHRFGAALRTVLVFTPIAVRPYSAFGLRAGRLRRCAGLLVLSSSVSCVGSLDPPPPRTAEQFTAGRELSDLDELARLRALAEREPTQLDAQWQAGMAHVRATLHGHVDQRDHAERYLERAWRLDPTAEKVPAARVLARFLNMRSTVLDLAKLDLQIELYRSLLDANEGVEPDARAFHFASFAAAAEALDRYANGDTLAALRKLAALERAMHTRTREQPEDIDTSAMAGNFELTFAGMIPIGVDKRLRRGVAYLETQQDHWQQLSPLARNTGVAPNVRSVFALYLAEGLLAAGEVEAAAARYEQILNFSDQPETVAREQILAVARHRLANLDTYAGDLELLPPWPAGVTGCVACHSRDASLPIDDLYVSPGIELAGVQR